MSEAIVDEAPASNGLSKLDVHAAGEGSTGKHEDEESWIYGKPRADDNA